MRILISIFGFTLLRPHFRLMHWDESDVLVLTGFMLKGEGLILLS